MSRRYNKRPVTSAAPKSPPASPRAIIHVDMDAFYASVEQRDHPELAGRPVIVGGTGNRGVVSAASYEARKFGVHSAMPVTQARRLCPHGEYVPPRMAVYRDVSGQVFRIFREFTPLVQGLSLDEAFLDVTGSLKLFGDVEAIGEAIRDRIRESTGLAASVGMAENKFLAKLASDYDKPDGFVHIPAGDAQRFLDPLPLRRLWGIGRKSLPRLKQAGLLTVGDLRRADPGLLAELLGNRADHFQRLARGEDQRPVEPVREDKSISHEQTFDTDLSNETDILAVIQSQSMKVARRLRNKQLCAGTVTVKLRNPRFETASRSQTLQASTQSGRIVYATAKALYRVWRRQHRTTELRLVGVGVSQLAPLHDPGELLEGQDGAVDRLMDDISNRFGDVLATGRIMARRKEGSQ